MPAKTTDTTKVIEQMPLQGLRLAPPQVLGGVRLVPLLRETPADDLRLGLRRYDDDQAAVAVDPRVAYYSYVPHGLVANWTDDGSPAAAFGTQLKHQHRDGKVHRDHLTTARVLHRMRKREGKNQLRFLPLHMAMEGFLALHFGGPGIAWEEYSRAAMRDGLSPRGETAIPARWIVGLEDALRCFEIHEGQVGMLVFVADSLASAFVVPHPDDYRRLHETLITDFYGELMFLQGLYAEEHNIHPRTIDIDQIESLNELRGELSRLRDDWARLHDQMASQLIDRPVHAREVYDMGPFRMRRFVTDLDPKSENHIGETIVRQDGTLEYLKTYRLSAAQTRRAYLLQQLAESDWNLEVCAANTNSTKNQLIYRIENAGFGYLLHQHVLDAARSARRKLLK